MSKFYSCSSSAFYFYISAKKIKNQQCALNNNQDSKQVDLYLQEVNKLFKSGLEMPYSQKHAKESTCYEKFYCEETPIISF